MQRWFVDLFSLEHHQLMIFSASDGVVAVEQLLDNVRHRSAGAQPHHCWHMCDKLSIERHADVLCWYVS